MNSQGGRRRLRVALLTPCFWPEVRRGSERVVHELATGLIARGHRPTLISSHPGRPSRGVEAGVPIVRNWRPPDGRLRRRLYEDHLTHVPFSYMTLRLGRYDVAQAVFVTDALAALRWRSRTGRPAIFSFMGVPDHSGLVFRRGRLEMIRRAVTGSDAVVALSEAARDAFWRWLGVETRVIHPGVDIEAFTPGPGRAAEPTIFCAADLGEPRKRVGLLVAAARSLRRERPDLRLVLARPTDSAAAARIAAEEPWIELRDVDRHDRLLEAYRQSWVSALPSHGEAFGLVLAEALACGTPVVGSNLDGIPEVIGDDPVGRLFDGDERALSHALAEGLELAQDDATAAACRTRAERFSRDRCVDAYEHLYAELLDGSDDR